MWAANRQAACSLATIRPPSAPTVSANPRTALLSAETATAYREALNHLLSHHSRKLVGAKVVHWYQGRAKVEKEEDPIAWLDEPPRGARARGAPAAGEFAAAQRRAAELLDALRTGKRSRSPRQPVALPSLRERSDA